MSIFKGCGVAMVTPFKEKEINYEQAKKLTEFLIQGGVDSLIVLGTTGEASTMSLQEKIDYIKFIIETTNKRIPVIIGTGGNNTETAADFSMEAENLGADGLLIVTPYYNKCTQNGLIKHYEFIASKVHLPIIAYNVPGRTGFNILPDTAIKLAEIKNLVAIKEASGNMAQIQELLSKAKNKIDVYSGDDALTAMSMCMGAIGVISVAANVIPAMMSTLTRKCMENKWNQAKDIQLRLLPLIKAIFSEVNPIPIKKALQIIGFDVGNPRLPLTEIEPGNEIFLKKALTDLNII